MTNTNTGFSMVNHVGITVSNLERSIQFYEALTGKKIANKEIGWCLGASLPLLKADNWKCKIQSA